MTEEKCERKFVEAISTRLSQIVAEISSIAPKGADLKRLLVAFSGGPDSTALLIALAQVSQKRGWQLHACHINHGLRGLESDLDQEFCEKLCQDLGVVFAAYRIDELSTSESNHVPENLLRELRYARLLEHARSHGIPIVLTGHTLDDQAETLLFRMFRGTSPAGLVGMEPKREMVAGSGIFLVRPLLDQTKVECQRFLAIEQIAAHFDSSNEDSHYARNYIRTHLIPAIDEKFPGWKNRMDRLRLVASEQEQWLSEETNRKLAQVFARDETGEYIERSVFSDCHIALKRRLVARTLRDKLIEPSFERIENVMSLIAGSSDSALTLSPSWEIRIDNEKVRIMPLGEDDEPSSFMVRQETVVRVPDGESRSCTNIISWLDKSIKLTCWDSDEKPAFPPPQSLEIYADLSRVSGAIKVRLRRPGDVIQPFGMKEQVRLKKYLHTHEQAEIFRHTVVLTDDVSVLWVPGVGYSERLRCHGAPTHRLIFLDLAVPSGSVWA